MTYSFVALSGIDGAGKSTQLELLERRLRTRGRDVVCMWTRGGSTSGALAVKALLRILAGKRLPAAGNSARREELLGRPWIQQLWLLLAILDLIRIYGFVIRAYRLAGKAVICDRYLWDSLIDFKIMFPSISVEQSLLWRLLVFLAPVPERAVLLMIPLALSEARCAQKYDPFPETPERRKRRFQLYEEASVAQYWEVIDSTDSRDTVFRKILNEGAA